MNSRADRERAWNAHQVRGWAAYGLREVVVERMLPDLMQIETTSVCNLRCVFCPYDELTRAKQHMDVDKFAEFLSVQAGHVQSVGLHHFGEPFLNRRLPDYIAECTGLGIDTTVSTNATRISDDAAEAVIGAGLTRLIVSLDAVTAEDYERLRVGGRFADVVSGIDRLLAAKARLGGATYIQLQFIATPENSRTWPAFSQMWRDRPGVDQVVLRDERTHAGQRVRHDSYRVRSGGRLPCRYLWESLVVLADGSVVPCCKDFDGKVVLGNVFTGDRLVDIWNGPEMVALRRSHVEGDYAGLPLCGPCTEWPGHAPITANESRRAFLEFRRGKAANRMRTIHRRDFE